MSFGKKFLKGVKLDTGRDLEIEGLFIEIGSTPSSEIAGKLGVELNEDNSIKVNHNQETNVPGVYAAGDITKKGNGFRQILIAAAEGAIAAKSAYTFLRGGASPSQWG